MTTYTLSGNIHDLIGGTLTSPSGYTARAVLVPLSGQLTGATDIRVGGYELTIASDGSFSRAGLPVGGYRVDVHYYDPVTRSRTITGYPQRGFNLTADTDLATVVASAATAYVPVRPALDHGNVSGTVTLDATYGLHELNMVGNTTLTPTGPAGCDMAVRITGSGTLTVGATWDSSIINVPGTMLLTNWLTAGWRAVAVAPIVPTGVTPAAVTFDDTAGINRITIPSSTGVAYTFNAVVQSAGNYDYQPAGAVIVTAAALSGYVINTGATTSWSHTFGTPAFPPVNPSSISGLQVWYDANAASALTISSGVSNWRNDGVLGSGANDLTQATVGLRPGTTTVNSKTAITAADNTHDIRRTSYPAAINALPITLWGVIRLDAVADRTILGGGGVGINSVAASNVIRFWNSAPTSGANRIDISSAFTSGNLVFVCFREDAVGNAKAWVGNNTGTGTITTSGGGLINAFCQDFEGATCEWGCYSVALTDTQVGSIYAFLKSKWNTL